MKTKLAKKKALINMQAGQPAILKEGSYKHTPTVLLFM